MVDLDEIYSLQDHSGMLYAGAVLEWIKQTDRDPNDIRVEDIDDYRRWVDQNEIGFAVATQRDFRRILGWIHDPEWDNSEAHDLFIQVEESEYH